MLGDSWHALCDASRGKSGMKVKMYCSGMKVKMYLYCSGMKVVPTEVATTKQVLLHGI
jgi:hypothetical protein